MQQAHGGKNRKRNARGFCPKPTGAPRKTRSKLKIVNKTPFFNLPNVNGKFISIDDFEEAEVSVINFTWKHCPTAQAYEDRYTQLVDDNSVKSVRLLNIITANSSIGTPPEELW
jgi:hypothetical protein